MNPKESFIFFLTRIMLIALFLLWPPPRAVAETGEEFSKSSIDIGIVVSDLDEAVKFYTQALGFKEIESFSIPGDIGEKLGLTDSKSVKMRVLMLEEEENATKLKLIKASDARSEEGNNRFIHSQLGFRYITIFVNDMKEALSRLKKADVTLATKKLVIFPKKLEQDVYLAVIRDPDGNLIELVGPKD